MQMEKVFETISAEKVRFKSFYERKFNFRLYLSHRLCLQGLANCMFKDI